MPTLPITSNFDPDDAARAAVLLSPSALYLELDDELRVTAFNSVASVTLEIRSRILGMGRKVQVSRDTLAPSTSRAASSKTIGTDEGWLIGGEVFVSGAAPLIGQCYVVVEVVRGLNTNAPALQLIAGGYVTANTPLPFPAYPIGSPLDGGGALRSIAGTTPGAGVELSEAVPTGARWELLAFSATFVTSAAVANRVPQLTLDDGTTVYFRLGGALNQAASLTQRRVWFQGAPAPYLDNANSVPGPIPTNLRLGAGHRIRTLTAAIDVADQWSAVQYLVREWIEGA